MVLLFQHLPCLWSLMSNAVSGGVLDIYGAVEVARESDSLREGVEVILEVV